MDTHPRRHPDSPRAPHPTTHHHHAHAQHQLMDEIISTLHPATPISPTPSHPKQDDRMTTAARQPDDRTTTAQRMHREHEQHTTTKRGSACSSCASQILQ